MRIIEGTTDFCLDCGSAVAIGKFDGIHLGHRALLHNILGQREQGLKAAVFTFDPPPSVFFHRKDSGEEGEKALFTRVEKRKAFAALGVDVLIEFPLNERTAAIQAEDFVAQILAERLKARYVTAGTDLSFGDRGAGNCTLLQALAGRYGYETQIIDKIRLFDREVSSTFVREEVERGHMETAAKLLGSPYTVNGVVVKGSRLGRTIGMPTVNLQPPEDKLLPPNGVYFSKVQFPEGECAGITNIGFKPTVSNERRIGVETYLYDYEGDLYGEEITVALLNYKRGEIKFDGVEGLKTQLEIDRRDGEAYFSHGK